MKKNEKMKKNEYWTACNYRCEWITPIYFMNLFEAISLFLISDVDVVISFYKAEVTRWKAQRCFGIICPIITFGIRKVSFMLKS